MATKKDDGENTRKSTKRPVTPGVKGVVKSPRTKSTASRKPAAAPEQTTSPSTQEMVSVKPQTTFLSLVGANSTATVLENLQTSPAAVKTTLSDTLNSALKSQLSATVTGAKLTVLPGLVDKMSPVDIGTSSSLSIRAFLKQQLHPMVGKNPAKQKAADGEIAKLSDTTTIGTLLQLGMPLQDHALFQADAMKAHIATLLATSPNIASKPNLQEKFVDLYAALTGPIQKFWKDLSSDPEFTSVVPDLQFTLQLGTLTLENSLLVQALQNLRQQGTLQSLQDLVKLDANAWTQLINTPVNGQAIAIPPSVPGATLQEETISYVNTMMATLRAAFPTTAVAQSISTLPVIDLDLVKTVLAQNPHVSPAKPLPANLNLTGLSTDDQAKAKASLQALRHEINMFPGFDHKALLTNGAAPASALNPLRNGVAKFLANSPNFDLQSNHLDSYIAAHASTAFQDIVDSVRRDVTDQIKRLQRVFRVSPKYEVISALLGEGLDSAHVVSSVPQATFINKFQGVLGGEAPTRAVYEQAQYISAATTNLFSQVNQAVNDVTPRVIGPVAQQVTDGLKLIPNWESLFGSLSFCACDDCRSVLSPAAYFVDLLQFLKKSGLTAGKTPLEVLLGPERRPDLPSIELTCENTNTPIPYVDLVNETLEGYVALGHLDIHAKDTGDSTADELSANPQYINAKAYDILKKAVYPLTLPFNRALEVVRIYLEHLGTSRHQLMQTFQIGGTASDPKNGTPTGLAITCEYLGISLEEYAILTGTDPHTLPEFYGLRDAGVTNSWIASLQAVTEFLQRTGLGYSDLIDLLKMRFINPAQAITLVGPAEPVTNVAFSPDGASVLTGSADEAARLYAFSGSLIHTFSGHTDAVTSVTFSPDGKSVLTGSADQTARLWDAAGGSFLRTLSGHTNSVKSVAFSPDGKSVLTGSADQTARLWDAANGSLLHTFSGHTDAVTSVAFSSDGKSVLTGSADQSARLWDAANGNLLHTFSGHTNSVTSVAFSSDGKSVLTGSADQSARLWDAANGNLLHTFSGHTAAVTSAALSHDGKYVLTGSADKTARLWVAAGGSLFHTYSGHTDVVTSVAFSLQSSRVLTGSADQTARLWQVLYGGELIRTFSGHADADPCDVGHMTINNLDDSALKKIYRFIRLWRKLGWTMSDLDQAIRVSGSVDIDDVLLQNLARVKRLQQDLKLPLNHLLSFWADIGVEGRDSLYLKLFQNKAVLNPVDPDFALRYAVQLGSLPSLVFPDSVKDKISYDVTALQLRFIGVMNEAERTLLLGLSTDPYYQLAIDNLFQMRQLVGTELAIVYTNPIPARISDHIPTVLAALHIGATDLNALTADEGASAINLSTLSKLYRFALLARSLKLSVVDLVSLKTLTGVEPFQPALPASTVAFVEKLRKFQRSSLSVRQLNYLLRDVYDPNGGIAPLEGYIQLLINTLHDGLKKIFNENPLAPDPTGDVVRHKLALLLANAPQVINLIDGTDEYVKTIHRPQIWPTFPPSLAKKIRITSKPPGTIIKFMGAMTDAELKTLLALSPNQQYNLVMTNLWQQPRDVISKNLTSFLDPAEAISLLINNASLMTQADKYNYLLVHLVGPVNPDPSTDLLRQKLAIVLEGAQVEAAMHLIDGSAVYAASLANLPANIIFPDSLKNKITFYDKAQRLQFLGAMTDAEHSQLLTLSGELNYQNAINNLFQQPRDWISGNLAKFLVPADAISQLINNPALTQADRVSYVLAHLIDYLRTALGQTLIKQTLSENLKLEAALTNLALSQKVNPPRTCMEDFLALATAAPADAAKKSYRWLHKFALIANTFKLRLNEVTYLFDHNTRQPDLSGFVPDPLFDLVALRDSLPGGDVGPIDVFAAASLSQDPSKLSSATEQALLAATDWSQTDLETLLGPNGFILTDADFQDEKYMLRLQACFVQIQRLGTSASQLFTWAALEPDTNQAQGIKNTVKTKYDDATWLAVAKSLNDPLRESQKAALIACALVLAGFQDADQLFELFLIDVDTSACAMTSRIKQAISSIQLFVQRCLMNLEPDVLPSAIDSAHWQWMKHYRVWEANRKVFLYPENWIEPELRDDKSPFFKELESELRQNDITPDTADQAFVNYLEKLDEVSRLEICGMYYENEPTTTIAKYVHVFGRTRVAPHSYYYRKLMNDHTWLPWEKVQLDIEGDDLIPVVYNGRLYLFWPIFKEKAQQTQTDPSNTQSPLKQWEIQLAWSEYKTGKWSAKKLSRESLNWPTPDNYVLARDLPDEDTFSFKSTVVDLGRPSQHLAIRCYGEMLNSGKTILTGGWDGTAQLWYVQSGQLKATLSGPAAVLSVAFSPDGNSVLTGCWDAVARLWEGSSGQLVHTLIGHSDVVWSVAFSPDGKLLASGSQDRTVRLWAMNGNFVRVLRGHTRGVYSVAFSPDSKYVLTGSNDHAAILWDAQTGQQRHNFVGHTDAVYSVAFSPDGKHVLTGSADQTAKLWDVSIGQLLHTFSGHTGTVTSVAFSPDGKYVLTGSWDMTARLWQLTGNLMRSLPLPKYDNSSAPGVAFLLDGKTVLTGSGDTAQMWDTASGKVLRTFTSPAGISSVAFWEKPFIRYGALVTGTGLIFGRVLDGKASTAPGFKDITVNLSDPDDGTVYYSTQTLANGTYLFANVYAPHKYMVGVVPPFGYESVPQTLGPYTLNLVGGITSPPLQFVADLHLDIPIVIPGSPFGEFSFQECEKDLIPTGELDDAAPINMLPQSHLQNMMFVEDPLAESLDLYITASQTVPTLKSTPSTFRILPPPQLPQFFMPAPFFYQDDQRVYLATPPSSSSSVQTLSLTDAARPRYDPHQLTNTATVSLSDNGGPPIFDVVGATAIASRAEGSNSAALGQESPPHEMLSTGPTDHSTLAVSSAATVVASAPSAAVSFATFYHPHVCDFIRLLNQLGIPGLLTPQNQQLTNDGSQTVFEQLYLPTNFVQGPFPKEDVDFTFGQVFSPYNWELFFHIPFLIAARLSKNQRFEEAQQWFHYLFNPTDNSSDSAPQRYWRVLPFRENTESERIQDLLMLLDYPCDDPNADPDICARKRKMEQQISQWSHHPFDPHLIARLRLIAYQKTVVMKYIDNLIAWGDQLFRQETIEAINEATQLYILAKDILGPRPERIPMSGSIQEKTYADVENQLDSFSNVLVSLENAFPFSSTSAPSGGSPGPAGGLGFGTTFYFCVPQNDKLLGYWDTVADRLFKVRHCMDIEGLVRQPPLFEPPIDPSLLVRAAAMGVDLTSALNDINAATPYYRFSYILPKAIELCAEVRALGAALLAALEKKDSEALSVLRATQEINLLNAVRQVKLRQIEEAGNTLEGLQKSREVVSIRHDFYANIKFMNEWESGHLGLLDTSKSFQIAGTIADAVAGYVHLYPNATVGFSGLCSPVITVQFGGQNLGSVADSLATLSKDLAAILSTSASMSATYGSYQRRMDEWKLQELLTAKELEQIDKQIAAAQIRAAIGQLERDNHDKQIENATATEVFLHDKYTNQDLYSWMVSQISAVFFQCYQMAFDLAKRAEKGFRFERGLSTSDYIRFGYWDSLKQGLLSGEHLYLDLKRLEMAFLDQNKREYEITKHISLVLHDPMSLIALKETGQSIVELPEALFDIDYPGHYMRRIKNVSVTIPCVIGPYTSINCTLTLLSNKIRSDSSSRGNYSEQDDDPRFIRNFAAIQSIAMSHAQNDSGLFELNFRDERYLPFEGAGAISRWKIELPLECNAFDFETISDVIFKLNYTAREGGAQLRTLAWQSATLPQPPQQAESKQSGSSVAQPNLARMFSAKHEFSNEWYRFLHPTDSAVPSQTMRLDLTKERFPFQFRGQQLSVTDVRLFLKLKDNIHYDDNVPLIMNSVKFQASASPVPQLPYAEFAVSLTIPTILGLGVLGKDLPKPGSDGDTTWWEMATVNAVNYTRLKPDAIEDIWIVCQYSAASS